jgi:NAD-dependent dihydropyrimidine dehydrogenase PreA subunit
MPEKTSSSIDIFGMLSEDTGENAKKKRRQELLEPTGVKELFKDGKIKINKFTCVGGQCKLCIKACPTNALYWSTGGVGITEDLCVYCGACVLNCMVDDCIQVERKREDGKVERFTKPQDVIKLGERLNSKKRVERVKSVFPQAEVYCERYSDDPDAQIHVKNSVNDKNTDKEKTAFYKTARKVKNPFKTKKERLI